MYNDFQLYSTFLQGTDLTEIDTNTTPHSNLERIDQQVSDKYSTVYKRH